jgi:hypothetical protein
MTRWSAQGVVAVLRRIGRSARTIRHSSNGKVEKKWDTRERASETYRWIRRPIIPSSAIVGRTHGAMNPKSEKEYQNDFQNATFLLCVPKVILPSPKHSIWVELIIIGKRIRAVYFHKSSWRLLK